MNLSSAAAGVLNTWWSFVNHAASAGEEENSFQFTITDAVSAASDISQTEGGRYASWSPIGISSLFSIARNNAKAGIALNSAADQAPIDASMVGEQPWSRDLADQTATPTWHAVSQVTYINPVGEQVTEHFTVVINDTLPTTVGDLRSQVSASIDAMLTNASTEGTPRRGQLVSVDSIKLFTV